MSFELDTSKNWEKFTDHDGVVRFLKFQKIKKLYIYKGENGKTQGGQNLPTSLAVGQILPPLR